MRKMFSKNQIKRLIEDDMSGVTVTKGEYTIDASVKITKLGKCITITGEIAVNNTSGASLPAGKPLFKFNNLTISDNIDASTLVITNWHNSTPGVVQGTISTDGTVSLNYDILTGITTYYFDADLIDDDYIQVEGE